MARKSKKIHLNDGWAIYLRTSTDDNQAPERSQESQRRVIHDNLIKDSGLLIIDEYADTYSGRSTDRKNYQRMLADARQGRFSHVAVYNIDRFGRNDVECGRAFDELVALGITVKIANYVGLDPSNAAGRMIVGLMSSFARYESDQNSERTREGMRTKLFQGGWSHKAPDGYLNMEERVGAGDRQSTRYRRWIETDPVQSKVWRYAWDLLLSSQYTLFEIAEKLHERGCTVASGKPFVTVTETGMRVHYVAILSRVFHNWFYAGWVVISNNHTQIPPKEIRGNWEPIVSTEEFERGLEILMCRNKNKNQQRRHFYLLQGLIYMVNEHGNEERLICTTSNSHRKNGGNAYYYVQSTKQNFRCSNVEAQVQEALYAIRVDPAYTAALQQAYDGDLEFHLRHQKQDDRAELEAKLQELREYEKAIARKYAKGLLTDGAYHELWREYKEQYTTLSNMLDNSDAQKTAHLNNLDAALQLMTKLGILYQRVDQRTRKSLLKHIFKRVVVNSEGVIVRLDLRSPFTYLCQLSSEEAAEQENGAEEPSSTGKTNASEGSSEARASYLRLCVQLPSAPEQAFSFTDLKVLFFSAIAYSQRSKLERFLLGA